jgi:ribosome maturation factor RimP
VTVQGGSSEGKGGVVSDELSELVAPVLAPLGLDLVDVELQGAVVRVVVDRAGGADLDTITDATRSVSAVLDAHDPYPGHRYTLEVSSPGVERRLRTARHFASAVGEVVSVRTVPGTEGERRVQGVLVFADGDGILVEGADLPEGGRRLVYAQIERARTVFEWGTPPRPVSGGRRTGPRRSHRHSAGATGA